LETVGFPKHFFVSNAGHKTKKRRYNDRIDVNIMNSCQKINKYI